MPSTEIGLGRSSTSTVAPLTSIPFAASARRIAFAKYNVGFSTDTFLMCRTRLSGTVPRTSR
jgi:hypothetical protein